MNTTQLNSKLINQTAVFSEKISIKEAASIVGVKESEGPLKEYFDILIKDAKWGEKTYEKCESKMLREVIKTCIRKSAMKSSDISYMFSGDLLNQCISSSFSAREFDIPYFGLYGACSTFVEGLSLGSILIESKIAKNIVASASSHFCTAERQYRTPLTYGGQRTPTAQWTVTGAGSVILSNENKPPYVKSITTGRVVDMGIKDPNNMGGAMAPAAKDTILNHFKATNTSQDDYDLILSGDLGKVGKKILIDWIYEIKKF